jgi:hypothetical protein
MKALSIKQPYASLIAHGIKNVENRSWRTHFRGKIYIHASAKPVGFLGKILTTQQYNQVKLNQNFFDEEILNSSIIGEVDIVDCVINHPSIWAEKSEIDFGDTCIKNDCPEFIEWNCGTGMCQSCKLVGQSYFVGTLPKDCLFKKDMPKPIYNWVLSNPILYDKPILNVKGKLSFWEPDIDLVECIACSQPVIQDESLQDDSEIYYHKECYQELLPTLIKEQNSNKTL